MSFFATFSSSLAQDSTEVDLGQPLHKCQTEYTKKSPDVTICEEARGFYAALLANSDDHESMCSFVVNVVEIDEMLVKQGSVILPEDTSLNQLKDLTHSDAHLALDHCKDQPAIIVKELNKILLENTRPGQTEQGEMQ